MRSLPLELDTLERQVTSLDANECKNFGKRCVSASVTLPSQSYPFLSPQGPHPRRPNRDRIKRHFRWRF